MRIQAQPQPQRHRDRDSRRQRRRAYELQPAALWSALTSLVLVLLAQSALHHPARAVKFDLEAGHSPHQRCIWNYAMADTLVVIT